MAHTRSIPQVRKYWATLLFGTFTTFAIYLVLHSRSPSFTFSSSSPTPPPTLANSATHKNATYHDTLKHLYPIEHALLDLFPKETKSVLAHLNNEDYNYNHRHHSNKKQHGSSKLNTIIMNWLLHWRPLPFSWSQYYHSIEKQQTTTTTTASQQAPSYQCQDVQLPYPILRHMVKQVLQLQESDKPTFPMMYHPSTSAPDLTQPFLLLPFDTQDHTIPYGEPICIRAIIPPSVLSNRSPRPTTPFHYRYQPYTKHNTVTASPDEHGNNNNYDVLVWWDMMQVSARHVASNASIPLTMTPWHGHRTLHDGYQKKWFEHENNIPNWSRRMMEEMDERHWLHVYETNAVLLDPGEYILDGKLEFQDAYWNADVGPVQPYQPVPLPVAPRDFLRVSKSAAAAITTTTTSADDDVKQLVLDHLALPVCKGGQGDYEGRWLPWPFGDLVDASLMVTGLDKHGKFWAPFVCRYRPLTHHQFHRCLSRRYPRGMNIYGDSNMRRSIKSFLSHGQWCKDYHHYSNNSNNDNGNSSSKTMASSFFTTAQHWEYLGAPHQLRACHCEDFKEATWNPIWFNATARRWDLVFENTQDETHELGHHTEWDLSSTQQQQQHDGIRVSSYKWDGLTFMNDQGWQAGFTQPAYTLPSNTDVVVISLVNWDMAYMQLDDFRQALNTLVQHLKAQYDDQPLLIYRTPQYYCCRVDQTNRQRKSNTARMKLFEQAARQVLQAAFADRWMVWDVMAMGEARTWDEKLESSTCGANHAQADVIHLENQVLMNALCNPS